MINNVADLVNNITPDIYKQLKRAVELGKWPTGEKISKEQRELCLQAVIAYENIHVSPEDRTGHIPPKEHTHCGSKNGELVLDDEIIKDNVQPLSFK